MKLAKILIFSVCVIFGTGVFAGLSQEPPHKPATKVKEQQEEPIHISAFSVLLY